jgi:hypothetical protein
MSELDDLTQKLKLIAEQAYKNGVADERIRVLRIISEEANSQVAGWTQSDWITALIEGRDN